MARRIRAPRLSAQRWIVAVCGMLVCLTAGAAARCDADPAQIVQPQPGQLRPDQAQDQTEADQVQPDQAPQADQAQAVQLQPEAIRPFTSLDLRYSAGAQYATFSIVRGPWIFPNISYQRVAIFNNLSEISLSAGYQFIQQPGFVVAFNVAAAENSLGTVWVEPGLGIYWAVDRLTVSASGGYAVYLNSAAAPFIGIDPVEVSYQLDDHWTVGASATSFVVGQPISLDILPFVRYDTGAGFIAVGLDNLGPGFSQEIQVHWALYF